MQKIYILQGTTGEYSDRTDWIVRTYLDEATAVKAQQDVTDAFAKLWKFMEANQISYWDYFYDPIDATYNEEAVNLFAEVYKIDPKFQMDYTGTSWWVKECELV